MSADIAKHTLLVKLAAEQKQIDYSSRSFRELPTHSEATNRRLDQLRMRTETPMAPHNSAQFLGIYIICMPIKFIHTV